MLYPILAAWEDHFPFLKDFEFGRDRGLSVWIVLFVVLLLVTAWIYRKDTRELSWYWRAWLFGLRLGVLLTLLAVALLPQIRQSHKKFQDSRVALLIDTSLSMGIKDQGTDGQASPSSPSRADAVQTLLEKSPVLQKLRETHTVSLYTFDGTLVQQNVLQTTRPKQLVQADGVKSPGIDAGSKPAAETIDWATLLKPRGAESRIGESLVEVIRREAGPTLAGMAMITDGGSNAGVDPLSVIELASQSKVKLVTVGVGSTNRPVNLQVSDVQSPRNVHRGDGFTMTAFVSAQGMAGKTIDVELSTKKEGDEGDPTVIEVREITILEDGVPVSVPFEYNPGDAGRRQFRVKVKPKRPTAELVADDNERQWTLEVVDRKTKVLLLAGGPMRDYQFVRNLLFRDKTISMDVFLQTGVAGIAQESEKLLSAFPAEREELFQYDVIIAFDPNWKKIRLENPESFKNLTEWVFAHAGGLILMAGEVHTPDLAAATDSTKSDLAKILELYPVVLDAHLLPDDDQFQQAWPLEFTREGLEAEFLRLTDKPESSAIAWKEFAGLFRVYPTETQKAGATVLVRLADPRSLSGPPILMASQFYGVGRVLYVGSGELWRLRGLDEDFYDRLWIKLLREVGQGRMLRGTTRGILLLDKKEVALGSSVQLRARVLDNQFKEYQAERLPIDITDPKGKLLSPPVELMADKNRPGHFTGVFVAGQAGEYLLDLPIPESSDHVRETIGVKLPNLEFDRPEQNEALLKALVHDQKGTYLSISEAAAELVKLFPDVSTETVVFETPKSLWDRSALMYALVMLLSLEWLTRKLLKLA